MVDVFTKFNRALAVTLLETSPMQAIQLYREYLAYLDAHLGENGVRCEIQNTKILVANKLNEIIYEKKLNLDNSFLIIAYQELLGQFPRNYTYLMDSGNLFFNLGQFDIALELYARAEKIYPDNPHIKLKIVDCLIELNHPDIIEKKVREIENLNVNLPEISKSYNFLYQKTNNEEYLKKAILNAEIAVKNNPNNKTALKNLTVLYLQSNDNKKANEIWNEILKSGKLDEKDSFDYACHLIRMGEIKKGFEYYESRIYDKNRLKTYPDFKKPMYSKTIKPNKLLIQSEQGIGDCFLFARFLPLMKDKAKKLILRVPKTIEPIFKRNFKDIEVISIENSCPNEIDFDYHLPMMSLPYVLSLSKNDVLYKEPYLLADTAKVQAFKQKYFTSDKLKIGFAYEGNKDGLTSRNLPFEELKPLFNIENAEFFALQYATNDNIYKDLDIINLSPEMVTFDDTMALIENLDIFITVDNALLNLAGAMGKKTFAIFNYTPEFRWFDLSGDDTKWYSTVKPYQAKKQGEFHPVIQNIINDIEVIWL